MTRCHAYFLFSKDSIKVRNLRLRPKVSFTVDVRDHVNPLGNKGVMIQGRAEVGKSNDPYAEIERIRQLFEEKYGWSGPGSFFRRAEDEKVVVDVSVSKVSCWQGPAFLSCPKFCIASDKQTPACLFDHIIS
jgi:nitroimidazol reductase NimA-like FMN-containing flavoprotein (pyridoxamine 5'-phosphate oxidase superfamily)